MQPCPKTRHYCNNKQHRAQQERRECMARSYLDGTTQCTRLLVPTDEFDAAGNRVHAPHDGQHAGYGFSTTSLLTW